MSELEYTTCAIHLEKETGSKFREGFAAWRVWKVISPRRYEQATVSGASQADVVSRAYDDASHLPG